MSDLYDKISSLCTEKNINITEMCRRSGASRGSITDLKQGRKNSLSAETLSKIASYFDVSVDYLLGNTDIKKETPTNQDITFDDFTYALHNETKELSEEKKQQLLEMARFFKQQQDKKKEK